MKARGKEKRKFWKKYTRGVRRHKSKKDGERGEESERETFRAVFDHGCLFDHGFLYLFGRSCDHRGQRVLRHTGKGRGDQEVRWSW